MNLIPMGYLYRQVAKRPEWLRAEQVEDIYSLHDCFTTTFADYIKFWKHNGFWLFDSPEIIESLAREHSISLDGMQLFYFEVFEKEFDEDSNSWRRQIPDMTVTSRRLRQRRVVFLFGEVVSRAPPPSERWDV